MKQKEKYSTIYIILLVINIVCLLTSNIITSKQVSILGLVFTAGDFLFPISYLINDTIVEVYGYEKAKFSIIISFLSSILMISFFIIAIALPYPPFYTSQEAFSQILSYTPRIVIASLSAYFIGTIFNSIIMTKLKSNKSEISTRTILSSIVGEALDTIVFITIAFIGTIQINELLNLILSVYLLKIMIEILFTPILLQIIKKIKKLEGV